MSTMETIIGHVREGNLHQLRMWLDEPENDVNQGDEHRFTLLHWAAREGQLGAVELLCARGARLNITNLGDETALHMAAAHGHLDVVHFLVAGAPHPTSVDVANEHGNTPLHYACFWNHLEIAEYLIKKGASLMQENKYGDIPLETARPLTGATLAQLAQQLGKGDQLTHRRACRDTAWISAKTRARDATLHRLGKEAWDPHEVELTGAVSENHGAEVLKGTFRRAPIVVKMLKLRNCTIRQQRDFKEEFPRLRIFNHPNLLPVLAISTDIPRLCLVSDFMPYGSLFDVLHCPALTQQRQAELANTPGDQPALLLSGLIHVSERQALRFALDIARGMEYLHTPELKVPNFRLNSKHVLIDEDIAKIGLPPSDLMTGGGTGDLMSGSEATAYPTTDSDELLVARLDMADYKFTFHEKAREYNPAWLSPEALTKKPGDINAQASDMWSFGVILWELATRLEPFAGLDPMVIGMQVATENLRLPIPNEIEPRMARLIDLCLKDDPGKRPRFDLQVLQILDKMREKAAFAAAGGPQQQTSMATTGYDGQPGSPTRRGLPGSPMQLPQHNSTSLAYHGNAMYAAPALGMQ